MNLDWLWRLLGGRLRVSGHRATPPTLSRRALQPGRQTTPSNALFGAFGWSAVPRRASHVADLSRLDTRQYSAQQLLSLLADVSPEVSLALWNVLRLGAGSYRLTALRPDGSEPDARAQAALDELLERLDQLHGGLDSLLTQWLLTLYLQGAAAAELVLLPDLRDVEDVVAVQPYTIEFRRDAGQVPRPWCQDATGQWKPLNEQLFWYVALDAEPDDPYGRAPAAPAIGEVLFDVQVLVDLKRALHTNAWGRLDVSVLFEMLKAAAPRHLLTNEAALWEWVNARLAEIKTQYDSLEPDDTFIHLDLVKVGSIDSSGKMLQVAPLIRVLELRIIRALKQLPVLMGSNEGTTETHGTVQYDIYASAIRALRARLDWLVERVLTTALSVKGVQARVELEWEDIRSSDRLKDAQAEQTEIANEAAKVANGWQTNDEAALAIVGHEAVGEAPPTPPARAALAAELAKAQAEAAQAKAAQDSQASSDEDAATDQTAGESADDAARIVPNVGYPPARRLMRSEGAPETPDGLAEMTTAERDALDALRDDASDYFLTLRERFPAREVAEQAVSGTPKRVERAEGDEEPAETPEERLARVRKLVDDWYASSNGRAMSEDLLEALAEHYVSVWNVEGAEAAARVGIAGSFELRNEAVIDALRRFAAEQVTNIDDTSKRLLANVIADSLAEGKGVDQIARDIRATFADWSVRRARLVAHTETGEQMSRCSLECYRRWGVAKKAWLTAQDSLVEEACRSNGAQGAIPMDQAFSSGKQAPLEHPACRCCLRPIIDDEWLQPSEPWMGE